MIEYGPVPIKRYLHSQMYISYFYIKFDFQTTFIHKIIFYSSKSFKIIRTIQQIPDGSQFDLEIHVSHGLAVLHIFHLASEVTVLTLEHLIVPFKKKKSLLQNFLNLQLRISPPGHFLPAYLVRDLQYFSFYGDRMVHRGWKGPQCDQLQGCLFISGFEATPLLLRGYPWLCTGVTPGELKDPMACWVPNPS